MKLIELALSCQAPNESYGKYDRPWQLPGFRHVMKIRGWRRLLKSQEPPTYTALIRLAGQQEVKLCPATVLKPME